MPALPEDIAAGMRAANVVAWADAAIKARYAGARDGQTAAAEGFFDSDDDAQAAADARGALLGTERRRFTVPVADLLWFDPSEGIPTLYLVDATQAAELSVMATRIEVDLEADATSLEVFG